MKDNDLIRTFRPIIINGLIAAGYSGVQVKQANQPTQQGANTAPTVYFYKLSDKRYGFLRRSDDYSDEDATMYHSEIQFYESQFQVSSLVRQSPLTPYEYTASDLVNEVSMILQSSYCLDILTAANIGVLRISNIRNPYFMDDRDQFEASPSFDFTLTYRQTRITTDPVVDEFEFNLYRV